MNDHIFILAAVTKPARLVPKLGTSVFRPCRGCLCGRDSFLDYTPSRWLWRCWPKQTGRSRGCRHGADG
jgi:hypothetical protein